MDKYLYGASLQGLQEFIFKTNKLKEIIGASEIIKGFDEIDFKKEFSLQDAPEIILQAAGNVRMIFENVDDVKKIVKYLPKKMMEKAFGITHSQSVVKLDSYAEASFKLEQNLKIQRNKNLLPLDLHESAFGINPKTGLPAVCVKAGDFYDKASLQKTEAYNEAKAKDRSLENLNIKNAKNKIAIIHIDGNGLGGIVRELQKHDIREFSKTLDKATKEAYKKAEGSCLRDETDSKKIRKVILGGDDVTLICSADIALDFTYSFLKNFEKNTKNIYKNRSLSACAGIAYCNEKFPFFYAVKLAENLCAYAKKHSKAIKEDLPPSSLMFHNIQSSNVESFAKFIADELVINGVCCDFGPYYIDNSPRIKDFLALKQDFQKKNSPKGRLRDWLNTLKVDRNHANAELKRIDEIFAPKWKSENFEKLYSGLSLGHLIIKDNGIEKTPIYDILQILSVEDFKEEE